MRAYLPAFPRAPRALSNERQGGDSFASFGNYGSSVVALAAPGVYILSTYPPNTYATLTLLC